MCTSAPPPVVADLIEIRTALISYFVSSAWQYRLQYRWQYRLQYRWQYRFARLSFQTLFYLQ